MSTGFPGAAGDDGREDREQSEWRADEHPFCFWELLACGELEEPEGGRHERVYGRRIGRSAGAAEEPRTIMCPSCGRPFERMADWPRVRVTGVEDAVDRVRDESLARLVRRGPLLVRWGTAPGPGNDALRGCLVEVLGLNWAALAEVHLVGGGRAVMVKRRNRWCVITLDADHGSATLEVDDGRRIALGIVRDEDVVDIHLPARDPGDEGTAPFLWALDPGAVNAAKAAVARMEGLVGEVVEPRQLAGPGDGRTAVGDEYLLYLDDDVLTLADTDGRVLFRLARVAYEGVLLEEEER